MIMIVLVMMISSALALDNTTNTLYACTARGGWSLNNIECILTGVYSSMAAVTLMASIFSAGRTAIFSKILNFPSLITFTVIINLILLLLYLGLFELFPLMMIWELLKNLIIVGFGYHFLLSTISVNSHTITDFLPQWASKRLITSIVAVLCLVVATTTGLAIYYKDSCLNIPRVFLPVIQFLFSSAFCVICFIILKSKETIVERRSRVASFLSSNAKLATVIAVFNTFVSAIYLTLRVFLFYLTTNANETCTKVLENQDAWIKYTYPVFIIFDMFGLSWAILWYFKYTVLQRRKSVQFYTFDQNSVDTSFEW